MRDANFRYHVCGAYENRCAVTGLAIINGGGRAEVQAAHIWPVAAGGPDVVQNGIALSSTVHWLLVATEHGVRGAGDHAAKGYAFGSNCSTAAIAFVHSWRTTVFTRASASFPVLDLNQPLLRPFTRSR
jgi:hypothetical protein